MKRKKVKLAKKKVSSYFRPHVDFYPFKFSTLELFLFPFAKLEFKNSPKVFLFLISMSITYASRFWF